MPLTATGVELAVFVPFPSCPLEFSPQQRKAPDALRMAQEWNSPVEIETA
jgi:hypothetical protein